MEEILEILKKIKPNTEIAPDTNLIESGILTSFDIIRLIVALNEEYDIEITPLHATPENFQTAEAIYNLVQKLVDED